MTLREYEALDEDVKVEFFDSEAGLAWMVREPGLIPHEAPGRRLAALAHEIALTRGSPIRCGGEAPLRLLDGDTGQVRIMHPDEMVFLRPEAAEPANRDYLQIGKDAVPDVVLQVDHTRDTRRDKLAIYEEWGLPELWVEVPDTWTRSRPRGLRPELRIYVLEGSRYVPSDESRAFPGWSAAEIHWALNEPVVSAETSTILQRVGRALGEREGTGPDDNPLLRSHRTEARAGLVRAMLTARGITVSPDFPPARFRAVLEAASDEAVAAAVTTAVSETDLLRRLRDTSEPG